MARPPAILPCPLLLLGGSYDHYDLPVRFRACSPPRLAATQLAQSAVLNRLSAPTGLSPACTPASRARQSTNLDRARHCGAIRDRSLTRGLFEAGASEGSEHQREICGRPSVRSRRSPSFHFDLPGSPANSPTPAANPPDHDYHQTTVIDWYWRMSPSLVMIVASCFSAVATIIRSHGSAWWGGKSVLRNAISSVTERTTKPWCATALFHQSLGSIPRSRRPFRCFREISNALIAETKSAPAWLAIISRAA